MEWTPENIRDLRGERTRAEFAVLVGVSPLTIYRWELPPDANESRSPRRAYRKTMDGLSEELRSVDPAAVEPLDLDSWRPPEGPRHLLATARWAEAESDALTALSSGEVTDPAQRAFLLTCIAKIQLLSRNEVRGAMATTVPLLADVGSLPPAAAAYVHATAAACFATPDVRVFDPIRCAAHAAQVPHGSEMHLLATLAAARAAYHHGDGALFRRRLDAADDSLQTDAPVLGALVAEALALRAELEGRPGQAAHHYADAIERATEQEMGPTAVRCLGRLALLDLNNAAHPSTVLPRIEAARAICARTRSAPGYPELVIGAAECEALFRLARVDEALVCCRKLEDASVAAGWAPIDLLLPQTRLEFHVGGAEASDALEQRFRERWSPYRNPAFDTAAAYTGAVADMCRGELGKSQRTLREAYKQAEQCGAFPTLERLSVLLAYASDTYLGALDAAQAGRRQAARLMERHPSAWFGMMQAHVHGMHLSFEGRATEAYQVLTACAASFERAGDVGEAARTRHAVALAAHVLGAPDADEQLRASELELQGLGIAISPAMSAERLKKQMSASEHSVAPPPNALVVPFRRLAMRGFTPDALLEEIRGAATTLVGTEVSLTQISGVDSCVDCGAEFSDGFGRQFRLSVDDEDLGLRTALELLAATAGLALELATLRHGAGHREDQADGLDLPGFIAASEASRKLVADLRLVARSRSTVLITGESGVGKEVVAGAVHQLSPRSEGPYVTFNAATVPTQLFEGQLFGYRKGAFTGAVRNHKGVIRAADKGTLFLDEIGDMPLEVQAKLLRFLENGEVLPLGETTPVSVDVRVVVATHHDLRSLITAGKFREDLYYRLQVVPVRVAPLRERLDDVVPLARHLIARVAGTRRQPVLGADAVVALRGYEWPGNVRELRNVIERTLAFAPDLRVIGRADLRLA